MARKLRSGADPLEEFGRPAMRAPVKRTVDAVLASLKAGTSAVSLLSALLASVMILYSGYVLYDNFATQYHAYSSSWDLVKYKPEIVDPGAKPSAGGETLEAVNKDYRAWLTLYDTNIDYPVVQGKDDLYYASRDVYQNISLTGAIYLAAGNNPSFTDSYNLIYGHHMDNQIMFGALDRYRDNSYYASHREGILVTKSGVYDLTVFAVAETDAYESQIYSVGNRAKEVKDFLTGDRSHDAGVGTNVLIYDRRVAETADRIVAFSTCRDNETSGRLVVFAKMTPRALPTVTPTATPEPTPTPTARPTGSATGTTEPTATPRPARRPVPTPTKNPGPYRLDIRYEYLDGTQAAPAVTETLMPGERYDVQNPEVPGYRTVRSGVSGTMGYRDVQVVVLYLPMEEGNTVSLEEYDTPLGLENLYAQMGICIE